MSNYIDYDNAVELFTEVGNKRKASESMQESLLKSTVGWTGKNLLENMASSRTVNGVAVTVNSDGSITLNGTHTASASDFQVLTHVEDIIANGMIISGVPSGASNIKLRISLNQSPWTEFAVDTGSGATISGYSSQTNVNCNLTLVGNGTVYNNVTIYPMLRDASITDDTYEPYHESVEEVVEQIYADNGVLGAKNLWDESHSFNSKTGVTYTLTDHIYTINTAAEDYSGIYIGKTVARQYYSNYVGIRAKMVFEIKGDSAFNVQTLNNVITSVSTEYKRVEIPISDLSQIDDIVFYNRTTTAHTITVKNLMIVLASDPDDTYVPYAMTNRELTEELTVQTGSAITSDFTVSFSQLNKYGKVVELTAKISGVTGTGFDTIIANIPTGYRCSGNDRRVMCLYSLNDIFSLGLIIKSNGDIQLMQTISGADVLIHAIWLID